MNYLFTQNRRSFIKAAALAVVAKELPYATIPPLVVNYLKESKLTPLRQVRAGVLDISYYELGPQKGAAVLLLHGFPYSINSFGEVAPVLAARGCRVIVPFLRGHGPTRFISNNTPRSGQQGAIGMDVVALMDALQLKKAVLAGYDWGGRAACVVAALFPERCLGLVSVNGYLIQDISKARLPLAPSIEAGLWYQFYFGTERGKAGLLANRKELARVLWTRNSPTWHFDETTFQRHAEAFDNPDFVEVVIHSYRHRLGLATGSPSYEEIERRLAALPSILVPAITLDGEADGVIPATDGSSAASKFSGRRSHRVIAGAWHNLPEEAPQAFTDAVWELVASAE